MLKNYECGPLDVEIISEEFIVMLRQLTYAIKNQDKWLHALKAVSYTHLTLPTTPYV